MGLTAAIIVGSLATAGASVYQTTESNKAAKKAQGFQEEQAAKQDALLKEANDKVGADKALAESNAARDAARTKQRNAAAAAQGRQSTLLTGPLGVTAPVTGSAKTILGG